MRILFASSEVYPFSKTGGLADVAGALPKALAADGHEVLVVTPWYRRLGGDGAPLWIGDVPAPFAGDWADVGVGTLEADGVRYAFVGHDDFRRGRLYGEPDDVRRFCRFTRAVPQVAERVGFAPQVAHAHDWHTGYLPAVLGHGWNLPAGYWGLPTVFTAHNVQYQGESGIDEVLHWLRLPAELRASPIDHFGAANALQAGLGFADRVTTVSPSYAEEVKRPEYGYGLDGTFRHLGERFRGILNGLDTSVWDPAHDPHLPQPFGPGALDGKAAVKAALCAELGLEPRRPLLGVVSRFAEQKGIDVLLEAAPRLLVQGWTLALLGAGDAPLEAEAARLAQAHPGRVATRIGYHEGLAHRIYGGADALAVPSRFEPCGLSQLIAMRYGTLPIARETGGLRDTIEDGRTGFLFRHLNAEGLLDAAAHAMAALHGQDELVADEMRREAMQRDFGWGRSARAYAELYQEIVPEGA